jgi:hypothetical protein
MKIVSSIIIASVFCLLANVSAYSETPPQTVGGETAIGPNGGTALEAKVIEVKSLPGNVKVARVVGSEHLWGFVNYWFKNSAPAGQSIVRVRVYVDNTAAAHYGIYVHALGDVLQGKLFIPASTKKNTFIDVDVPVESPKEWNGVSLKKMETSNKPSPWIDSVSLVMP